MFTDCENTAHYESSLWISAPYSGGRTFFLATQRSVPGTLLTRVFPAPDFAVADSAPEGIPWVFWPFD